MVAEVAQGQRLRFDWIELSRLWLVLDRAAATPCSLPEVASLGLDGGVDVTVFRMKGAAAAEALLIALKVRRICAERGKPFVLSHFSELVMTLRPDALHIGAADAPVAQVRRFLAPSIALGYSAHSVTEARDAIAAGADYCFLGPVFQTPSKALYGAPLGLEAVKQAAGLAAPAVFIGGMTRETIPVVVASGGQRVAAVAALQQVPDPSVAAAELRALLPL